MQGSMLEVKVREAAGLASELEAERALVVTLEALGFELPPHLVEALSAALPREWSFPLRMGHGLAGTRPSAASMLGLATQRRVRQVFGALCTLLEPRLVAALASAVPGWFSAKHLTH
jgi:uncharacterized protein (DUF2267 family)